MTTLMWIVSTALLLLGGLVVLSNDLAFISNVIRRDRFVSSVPLIGGVVCALGVLLLPVQGTAFYAWIPLLADWGTVGLVYSLLFGPALSRKQDLDSDE